MDIFSFYNIQVLDFLRILLFLERRSKWGASPIRYKIIRQKLLDI